MKNLKDLTESECIHIAEMIDCSAKWILYNPKQHWEGFDLMDNEKGLIFQIDFRSTEKLGTNSRFRLYQNLEEYPVDKNKIQEIFNYLKTLPNPKAPQKKENKPK